MTQVVAKMGPFDLNHPIRSRMSYIVSLMSFFFSQLNFSSRNFWFLSLKSNSLRVDICFLALAVLVGRLAFEVSFLSISNIIFSFSASDRCLRIASIIEVLVEKRAIAVGIQKLKPYVIIRIEKVYGYLSIVEEDSHLEYGESMQAYLSLGPLSPMGQKSNGPFIKM